MGGDDVRKYVDPDAETNRQTDGPVVRVNRPWSGVRPLTAVAQVRGPSAVGSHSTRENRPVSWNVTKEIIPEFVVS